jgi:GntR family transcriptional regulator
MTHQQARYLEIAAHLRKVLQTAEPGDLLPSDAELCQTFDVSRMTARQAVQLLVNEQLVDRRRGRGTFVAPRKVRRLLGSPLSFTENMTERGLTTSSRPLTSQVVPSSASEAAALAIDEGDPVHVIERVRLADGVPMAIERVALPTPVASLIDIELESGSLHKSFEEAGLIPSRATSDIRARLSTDWEQGHLETSPTSVILAEERTIFDQHELPMEHTVTVYAADRYAFSVVFAPATADASR